LPPRRCRPLADLGRRAFVAKFGHLYRPEDLAAFLDGSHTEQEAARRTDRSGHGDGGGGGRAWAAARFCKLRLESSSLPRVTDAAPAGIQAALRRSRRWGRALARG
jgi:hypothetical protein